MPAKTQSGAIIQNSYVQKSEEICPVPKSAIEDASSSAKEELLHFSAGGFMFSGAFWLGFERLYTEGKEDPLLWICVAFVLCGGILTYTGFRQGIRRVSRMEKYLPEADNET